MSVIKSDKLPAVSPVTPVRRYKKGVDDERGERSDNASRSEPVTDRNAGTTAGDDDADRPGIIDEYV